jgi:uncharacterized protein (DUF302 family)
MKTYFCHVLGIEHPIVAAPMGPDLTGPDLVAAVSNAGRLGHPASPTVPATVLSSGNPPGPGADGQAVWRELTALLAQKGIEVFAHIDHTAGAEKVGLSLRPTQVLMFGNPKAGTPLMQGRQTIGLDLPLRVLVWQDESDKVWLTYWRDLARRHHVTGHDEAVKALDDGLAGLARAATAKESGR